MLEECRLRLFNNLHPERRGGLSGRRRGGGFGLSGTSESIEQVVTDLPAAAQGAVARKCLNMSTLRTVVTIDPIGDRSTHFGP
jgi:hypothetical protein